MYKLTVFGKPEGKARPRMTKTGHVYTPDGTTAYEALVRQEFARSNPGAKPLTGAVEVEIMAFYAIPKSASKADRARMAANEIAPTVKPDWDNIGKIVCDALNGLAYTDDAHIVSACVTKKYGITPMVSAVIREARHEQDHE